MIMPEVRIHRLNNYDWEQFKKDISFFSGELTKIVDPNKISKISMRYTNLIRKTDGDFKEYINLFPTTTRELEKIQYKGFRVAITSNTDNPEGTCTIDVGNVVSKDEPCMLIEIGVRSKNQENLDEWCDSAHNKIKEMFERGITDAVRDKIR